MIDGLVISGFADEIGADFDEQLKTVTQLGMSHICLRAADGRGIATFTLDDARTLLLPRLEAAGVRVSSLGSPIGKIDIEDEAAFQKQLLQLETLCGICHLFGCGYIRVFSFYLPADQPADRFAGDVVVKLKRFVETAERHGVTLIHENEKGIFGDTAERCRLLFDQVASPNFKAAFDFANFVQCGEDPESCWDRLNDEVVYFHIKDARTGAEGNVLCGTGDGRIADILGSAVAGGYRGFLTLEPHLARFDTFASLERHAAVTGNLTDGVERQDRPVRLDGPGAYAAQYHALVKIVETLDGAPPVPDPRGKSTAT